MGREKPPAEEELPESCPTTMLDLPEEEGGAGEYDDDSDDDDNVTTTTAKAKPGQLYNRVFNLRCNLPRNRDHPGAQCATWPVPSGKLYLAWGNKTITRDYVQPLLIPEDILRRLAQPAASQDVLPTFNNEPLQCNHFESRDIRTVLDFAFASDRLILGMKCGVVLLKNLGGKAIVFDVAYLSELFHSIRFHLPPTN